MKKLMFALIASFGVSIAAHATVLDFESLTPDQDDGEVMLTSMSNFPSYGGLTWNSNFYLGDTTYAGYNNAAHSGTNFVNNGGANNLAITSGSLFDFAGAWFVTPNTSSTKASWINISAYDAANHLIGSTGNVGIGSTYSFIAAAFNDVSKLVISRDRGAFAMDDFTLADAEVPEPAGLFGVGLAAALLVSRRRNQRQQ